MEAFLRGVTYIIYLSHDYIYHESKQFRDIFWLGHHRNIELHELCYTET